jgi:hypothetical protein
VCNLYGENNGDYGISYWPPAYAGNYSETNCSNGRGTIRWLCSDNGLFDENGPEFSECWLDELISQNISNIDDVIEILEKIESNTEFDDSLGSMIELQKIEIFLVKLQEFIYSKNNGMNITIALNITNTFMNVFSNLINQFNAWINATVGEKIELASKLLLHIQNSSFISSQFSDIMNETIEIENRNIFMKIYSKNCREEIIFESNGSSVKIPKGLHFDGNLECYNYSVGYAINKLGIYLSERNADQEINTRIIAFSIKNTNKINQINDGSKVKIRYDLTTSK